MQQHHWYDLFFPFSFFKEFKYFLQAAEQQHSASTLCKQHELLKFLHSKLGTEKRHLMNLCKGDEDGSNNNIVVRLIYSLIRLSKSLDLEEASAAAKCLGEIGPIKLPAIAMKERTTKNECLERALKLFKDCKHIQYCWIFHQLCDYLVDSE